jgi:hypothetical protein
MYSRAVAVRILRKVRTRYLVLPTRVTPPTISYVKDKMELERKKEEEGRPKDPSQEAKRK